MDQTATSKTATSNNAPFRAACLTIYGKDKATPEDYLELPDKLDYFAYGHEVCPTTARPHLQAWAYASKAQRLSGWKKIFPGAHIEQMRGSFASNDKYCSKESVLTCLGEKPMEHGKKRSLQTLVDEVVTGARLGTPLDVIIDDTDHKAAFCQYKSGIKELHQMTVTAKLRKVDKNFKPDVIYIHGPAGSGKTRYARDFDENLFPIPTADGYKWKDGYAGQDTVLYDNVAPSKLSDPCQFLTELDRYFIQVPVKGAYIGWRPKTIFITSVYPPESLAKEAKFSNPQEFLRRITKVVDKWPALSFAPPTHP